MTSTDQTSSRKWTVITPRLSTVTACNGALLIDHATAASAGQAGAVLIRPIQRIYDHVRGLGGRNRPAQSNSTAKSVLEPFSWRARRPQVHVERECPDRAKSRFPIRENGHGFVGVFLLKRAAGDCMVRVHCSKDTLDAHARSDVVNGGKQDASQAQAQGGIRPGGPGPDRLPDWLVHDLW